MTKKFVEIFTDGACRGNPGPGGWGAILRYGDKEKEIWGGVSLTTNNQMEMQAVIEALKCLKQPCQLRITTDSSYVIKGITQWIANWKKNNWRNSQKKAVKNAELWQQMDELCQIHGEIDWQWVKGHSGHEENEHVDQLANRGIDEL